MIGKAIDHKVMIDKGPNRCASLITGPNGTGKELGASVA
jgi:transcriptional regulator with AAA-type ATPase domain